MYQLTILTREITMEKILIDNSIGLTVFNDVLTDEDINNLLSLANSNMIPGTVTSDKVNNSYVDPARTCLLQYLDSSNPYVYKLKRLSAELSNMPLENQESLQLIHYLPGGEYKAHYDSFNEDSEHINHSGNRHATVIFYLNDVIRGGATGFPNINKYVHPKKGSAVLFFNTDDNGDRLNNALHSGEAIVEGDKWIITSWIREHKV